ncbi:MAG: MASE1 domain-containing protein [Patescibacteria group bacterium]
MPDLLSSPTKSYWFKLLALAAVYLGVSYLSFSLVPAGGSGASLIWPPAAVGLAGLYLFGLDLWPALLVPFFLLLVFRGTAVPSAAGFSFANTAESLVGAYLLLRIGFKPLFSRLSDTFYFIVAAAVAVVLSATIVTSVLVVFGSNPGTLNVPLWLGVWIGHLVSIVSFAPFLLRWLAEPRFTSSRRELIEGSIAVVIIVVFTYLTAWTTFTSIGSIAFFYVIMIGLIFAALRTGTRGTTLSLMLFALILVTGILFGSGPSSHTANAAQTLFSTQVFIGVFSLIFLLFATVTEERREAVKKLEQHVGQLETSLERVSYEDQAKTDFIAILAHELRNPLSPILSSVELMKQNGIKPDNERHVNSIATNLHIMARLLDDLLDISRITQKKFKVQLEPVELKTIINQTLEIVSPYLESRKHMVSAKLPDEPVWLSADSVRLTQVFVNILNNAGKYTEPGGRIDIRAYAQGSNVIVHITDTGMGIEKDRMHKIFDSFGGTDGPARRPGGLHVGLSLAKRMVELHHGTIEPRSAGVGHGSEFIVSLPMLPGGPLPLEVPRRPLRSRFSKDTLSQLGEGAANVQILIVDDNEAAAKSLCELLQKKGRNITVAFNGFDGIAQATTVRPDVALLDIGLPDMDGYEVAKRLRAQFGDDIRLIALTGYGQPEDRQKARDAGFDEHVVKPVAIVDLERTLSELRVGA